MQLRIYSATHPGSDRILHVGTTQSDDPLQAVRERRGFAPELRRKLDQLLPNEPVVRTLEVFEGTPGDAAVRRVDWMRRLHFGSYADHIPLPGSPEWNEPATPPPTPPLPVDVNLKAEAVTVPVPEVAVTLAIRMRTSLASYAEIAGRLTTLDSPPGHRWQPSEVRWVIASAFYR